MKNALLVGSLLTFAFVQTAAAEMVEKTITYSIGDTQFESTIVYDDSSDAKRPGVVMVPNWLGPTPASLDKAKKIAGSDYVVMMADVYGVGVRPSNAEEAGAAAGQVRADRAVMRERVNTALSELKAQAGDIPLNSDNMAAIGFCFGGGAVLELARSGAEIDGVVSFHGSLDTPNPEDAKNIKTHILVLHGADDPFVGPDAVAAFEQEMKATDVDWQLVLFGGAVHSFTDPDANNPGAAQYDAKVAKRAYAMMHDFFNEVFVE